MKSATANRHPAAVPAEVIDRAIDAACGQIAPTWPLDQFVAVNPLWPLRGLSIRQAAARVAARGGARALPARAEFKRLWDDGRITPADLSAACAELDTQLTANSLVAHLDRPSQGRRLQLVADQLDAVRDLAHCTAWTEEIVHQISQLCASEFDCGQGDWPATHSNGLYAAWRYNVCRDRGIAILMGEPGLQRNFEDLPDSADTLIHAAINAMAVPGDHLEAYLHGLLLSVNGWASWCAYRGWQAGLAGTKDNAMRELLAIRLAWDWVLLTRIADADQQQAWQRTLTHSAQIEADHMRDQEADWIWLRALELGYQQPLINDLGRPSSTMKSTSRPAVQAAFCIDVRSEVFRRALEAGRPEVETLGFAGFFGAPIAHQTLGSACAQPQLPGLLAPSLLAMDQGHDEEATQRLGTLARTALRAGDVARRFRWGSTSTFSYVESTGLFYAVKLFKDGLQQKHKKPADSASSQAGHARPALTADGQALDTTQKVALAAGILRGISLTNGFAPLVLLAGHASQTRNNPQKSGLDCGACGGHSGEVNARVVAGLLNESAVRDGLHAEGISIPDDTRFVAGLHHTTTDDVTLFDLEHLTAEQSARVDRLRQWLADARQRANAERVPKLDDTAYSTSGVTRALQMRASDWSQVRPEWGLAANASLIVAPRSRTRGLNLAGRAFLHEYDAAADDNNEILEAIMTAPMIVAHWINFQYYASTVDNRFYGSGNKVLHNVAGGHIGLFEGNGGDLRTGLSLQSLHDGKRWMHEPLRLSVFIQASTDAIAGVIAQHEAVRQLVDNRWLFIYRIGEPDEPVQRYVSGDWQSIGETTYQAGAA
ncbi:MAG: DUF2309 domain-containing protein [Salinisphaera sp.]|jgi:uncharacterized protein YbcC (UPF0753/DUF2309 family)|nr:DUF2309 domain-containing protein [Salinisphaera sp.]